MQLTQHSKNSPFLNQFEPKKGDNVTLIQQIDKWQFSSIQSVLVDTNHNEWTTSNNSPQFLVIISVK